MIHHLMSRMLEKMLRLACFLRQWEYTARTRQHLVAHLGWSLGFGRPSSRRLIPYRIAQNEHIFFVDFLRLLWGDFSDYQSCNKCRDRFVKKWILEPGPIARRFQSREPIGFDSFEQNFQHVCFWIVVWVFVPVVDHKQSGKRQNRE